jgi:hypothetical protein
MTRILTTIFTGSDTCLEMIYWTKIEILEIARRYLHQQLHHHHHHRLQSLPSYRLCTFTAMHRSGDYLIFVPQTKRVGTYASSAAASDAAVTWTQFTFHGSLESVGIPVRP